MKKIEPVENYVHLIGQKVIKKSKKPFKSKSVINTVKGIVIHPILNSPSFTFEEDDSYVDCRICIPLNQKD